MPKRIDPAVEQTLLQMQDDKQYGQVVVEFRGGQVALIKRTESIKPAKSEEPNGEPDDE
jgi:hypothetical protein